jgi:hypothetical protein
VCAKSRSAAGSPALELMFGQESHQVALVHHHGSTTAGTVCPHTVRVHRAQSQRNDSVPGCGHRVHRRHDGLHQSTSLRHVEGVEKPSRGDEAADEPGQGDNVSASTPPARAKPQPYLWQP